MAPTLDDKSTLKMKPLYGTTQMTMHVIIQVQSSFQFL